MKLNPVSFLVVLCALALTLPAVSFAKSDTSNTPVSTNLESQVKSNLPRGWTTFSSNQFSVSYPSGRDWVYSIKFDPIEPLRVVFGPENKLNGQDVWTVTTYSTNVHSWKSVLAKVSQVQSGETAKIKKVKISGTSATMVTASSKDSTKKKRISVVVSGESVGRPNEIFVLSNGGLSEKGFETFYKSFRVVPVSSNPIKNKNTITDNASSSSTGATKTKSSK